MKKSAFFLIFGLVLTAIICAQPRYAIIPENPLPGEPVTIASSSNLSDALLLVNGRQYQRAPFFAVPAEQNTPGFFAAILTIPSTVNPGDAVIRLNTNEGNFLDIPITIGPREFNEDIIYFDPVITSIRTDASPQRSQESDLLWTILNTVGDTIYHSGPFLPPVVPTRRTGFFGDRRINVNSNGARDTSIHAGVDYGVPTGTVVYACGAGRVVLARTMITYGNTIVIEHAPGIYSLYGHLSQIDAQEGSIVKIGERIALTGATGIATGPHLHWEVRVNYENTDPDAFVRRLMIDKSQIISRIFN